MLNKILYLLIPVIFAGIAANGQLQVVDINDLHPLEQSGLIPDVMGKVLVSQPFTFGNTINKTSDTILPHPFWPKTVDGGNERGGVYANLDLDDDLEIVYTIGQKVHAFNIDGQAVSGWPKDLTFHPDGAPSFGDIDGDGQGEIVVTTHKIGSWEEGFVYAFERNGNSVFGFPVEVVGGPVRTPVLADIDGNGTDEIIFSVRDYPDGFVYAVDGNGNDMPGWPVRMNNVPATTAAVGDLDGDNEVEIIAESYTSLHVYNKNGTIKPGFPYTPGNDRVFSHSSPVLADLDDDGMREIIFGDHSSSNGSGNLHVLKYDGSVYPGYPKTTEFWIYAPPAVGDLNGDLKLDIIVADYFNETSVPPSNVYAWEGESATALPGFPVDSVFGVFSQAIMADLDGDTHMEFMIDANIGPEGIYYGFNHDGSLMADWPVQVNGTTFTINPFIVDLDGDGIADISGGGHNPENNNTKLYVWNSLVAFDDDMAVLPILQYNTRHNGVYGDKLMVGIGKEHSTAGNELVLSPNPVQSILNFVPDYSGWILDDEGELELWDLLGRKVKTVSIPQHQYQLQIDVSTFKAGIYVAILKTHNQVVSSKKFIVSR